MANHYGAPVGMAPQWAPHGPSQGDQRGHNYGWQGSHGQGPPSRNYAMNPNKNYGHNQHHQRNNYRQNSYNNYNQYNIHGNRPVLSCEPCGMTFGSTEILKEHLEEHVECPFPECKMKACIKIMDTHITNQHILVNFADLQIDNEQWIKQRKKRFPTAERAKIRREQQMEMIRRGQKIGLEKRGLNKNNKFDKQNKYESKPLKHNPKKPSEIDTNNEKCIGNKKRETFRERKELIKKEKREKFIKREEENNKVSNSFVDLDVYDSDSEIKDGLPAFKGTKLFYEEIGLVNNLDNIKNGKFPDTEEVLNENNFAISDDEEWNTIEIKENNNNDSLAVHSLNDKATNGSSKLVLKNALGSLMGAYDSDSEENEEDLPITESLTNKMVSENQDGDKKIIDNNKGEGENKNDCKNVHEPEKENSEESGTKRRRHRKHRQNKNKGEDTVVPQENSEAKKFPQKQNKHIKPRRPPPVKRRRPTLLMRLLEADIRHERNLLLQCIRYIVQNNFFEVEVECESHEELTENEQLEEDTNINNTSSNGQSSSNSAPKRKANSNLAESSKAKEAKLLDALTEFHKKNFDRVARNMADDDDDDQVTSVEAYLNMKK